MWIVTLTSVIAVAILGAIAGGATPIVAACAAGTAAACGLANWYLLTWQWSIATDRHRAEAHNAYVDKVHEANKAIAAAKEEEAKLAAATAKKQQEANARDLECAALRRQIVEHGGQILLDTDGTPLVRWPQ